MTILFLLALLYGTVLVGEALLILAAARRLPRSPVPDWTRHPNPPRVWLVAPCHNGEACIPGMVQSFEAQDYPADRRHLVIIADNCTDQSAELARSLGADVFERVDPDRMGKGFALDLFFKEKVSRSDADIVVLLDIDGRIPPDFLSRAVAHGQTQDRVIQGATAARNPDETPWTRIENLIQSLIRVNQRGRSALGLCPLMIGSHGIVIPRRILSEMGWRTTTVRTGDDLELGLRCLLNGAAPLYADDLVVENELTSRPGPIRRQRRRWTFTSLELTPRFAGPLLRHAFRGHFISLDALLVLLLGPSFSILLIFLFLLGILSLFMPVPGWISLWALGLLFVYGTYFLLCLYRDGQRASIRTLAWVPLYLPIRAIAFLESLTLLKSRTWLPTPHTVRDPSPKGPSAKGDKNKGTPP